MDKAKQQFTRTALTTSRAMDFFSEKELYQLKTSTDKLVM